MRYIPKYASLGFAISTCTAPGFCLYIPMGVLIINNARFLTVIPNHNQISKTK